MYRTIETDTWSDPWFEELTPNERLLFLYLITTGKQTSCGAFQISIRTLGYDTGLQHLTTNVLTTLCNKSEGRVQWWQGLNVIWVRNFYRHQRRNTSGTFTTSALKALADFPRVVQEAVAVAYPELSIPQEPSYYKAPPTTTLPIPYQEGTTTLPITEQNRTEQIITETESNTPATKAAAGEKVKRKHRIPDSFCLTESMLEYAKEKGFDKVLDLEKETDEFHDYWRGRGEPMLDWEATWRSRIIKQAQLAGNRRSVVDGANKRTGLSNGNGRQGQGQDEPGYYDRGLGPGFEVVGKSAGKQRSA